MLVVGRREQEAKTVSLRLRTEEDLGAQPVDEVVAMIRRLIAERSLELT